MISPAIAPNIADLRGKPDRPADVATLTSRKPRFSPHLKISSSNVCELGLAHKHSLVEPTLQRAIPRAMVTAAFLCRGLFSERTGNDAPPLPAQGPYHACQRNNLERDW